MPKPGQPGQPPLDETSLDNKSSSDSNSDFTVNQTSVDQANAVVEKPTNPGTLDVTQGLNDAAPSQAKPLDATQNLDKKPKAGLDKTVAQNSAANPPAATSGPEKVSTLGDFKLVKLLGKGGMGSVYKAIEMSIERPCALKVMAKHLADNKDFVERFKREARIQCNLDHQNIVRGYRVAEERGLHLFAMEFIDGGSVQGYLKKVKRFSVGDAVHITLAVLHAMAYAHEKSMIHRDIKPDNVMITSKGMVKVADLGLAKALDEDMHLTQSGMGAGTPYYMSPEQAANAKHVDPRTDIYAIGSMLYVFLTGELPFKGNTTIELIKAKEEGRFEPIRKHNLEVPEKLDLIVAKMIQKKPELRYQSCGECITALEGLALANPTLSFITGAVAQLPSAATAATKTKPLTGPGTTTKGPMKVPATTVSESATPETDAWFIRYRDTDGEYVHRKMKTHQIHELIKEGELTNKTEASRQAKEGYRPLATYREFTSALQARGLQAKADRRGEKVKSFMENIEKEEKRYQRGKWWGRLFSSVGGFLTLCLIILGVLGAIAATVYFGWGYIESWTKQIGLS